MLKLISISILFLLITGSCKKSIDEISKLPPETQTGANTFGCLINGKAWTPKGNDGAHPNYRIIMDPGSLDIRVYNYENQVMTEILIGCSDFKGVGNYDFNIPTKQSFGYIDKNCQIYRNDTAFRIGNFKITKFDSNIISGTFECTLYRSNCSDTIRFTNGRFDKKLY